jgi:hypothetical protein
MYRGDYVPEKLLDHRAHDVGKIKRRMSRNFAIVIALLAAALEGAANQKSQHHVIAFALQRRAVGNGQHSSSRARERGRLAQKANGSSSALA